MVGVSELGVSCGVERGDSVRVVMSISVSSTMRVELDNLMLGPVAKS